MKDLSFWTLTTVSLGGILWYSQKMVQKCRRDRQKICKMTLKTDVVLEKKDIYLGLKDERIMTFVYDIFKNLEESIIRGETTTRVVVPTIDSSVVKLVNNVAYEKCKEFGYQVHFQTVKNDEKQYTEVTIFIS